MKKKNKTLLIIGAGITGLSAGIHALKKGYTVKIFEKNATPGGCCNGWERNGYYIDNCMHWLTGTNQHTKLFKLWKYLGAMDETSNLFQEEYFYKSTLNEESIFLYSNINKVKESMIKLSPNDLEEITLFTNTVKKIIKTNQDLSLIEKPLNYLKGPIKAYFYYHNLSLEELSKKFKHPLLQKLFTDYFPKNYSALSLIYAYATFASGNGKVFLEGSKVFSENIAKKIINLGGEIYYNSNINTIEIADNTFVSISSDKNIIYGDYLIYTGDAYHLFNNLIPSNFMPHPLKKKFSDKINYPIISSFQVAILIDSSDSTFTGTDIFEIQHVEVGKSLINRLIVKDYSYLYNGSKKIVQLFVIQNIKDIEYWISLYKQDIKEYNKAKDNTVSNLISEVTTIYPNLKNQIKIIDSWTPATYNTYFNSYYGSYMGFVFKKKNSLSTLSPKIKGIKNMYYATYWQTYMGGLPIAAKLGANVSKHL